MALHALITGDLILSRAASDAQVDTAMACIRDAAATFPQPARFTRSRGDGWQVHVPDTSTALGKLLFIIAKLHASGGKIRTRAAVGIGTITTLGTRDLSDGAGPAFVTAGDALDTIPAKRRLTVAGTGVTPCHTALFSMADHITSGWTAAQAQAFALSRDPALATQADIAASLGITRQAVQLRLAGAGADVIAQAITAFDPKDPI